LLLVVAARLGLVFLVLVQMEFKVQIQVFITHQLQYGLLEEVMAAQFIQVVVVMQADQEDQAAAVPAEIQEQRREVLVHHYKAIMAVLELLSASDAAVEAAAPVPLV
jgi:hypothetical protein